MYEEWTVHGFRNGLSMPLGGIDVSSIHDMHTILEHTSSLNIAKCLEWNLSTLDEGAKMKKRIEMCMNDTITTTNCFYLLKQAKLSVLKL